jgi:hypothetical protein
MGSVEDIVNELDDGPRDEPGFPAFRDGYFVVGVGPEVKSERGVGARLESSRPAEE